MEENLWSIIDTKEKIGYLIYSVLNTLTAAMINNVLAIIMLPMALVTIYKHYEGFARCKQGLKYVGSLLVSMLFNTITLGAFQWYSIFGNIWNVDSLLRKGKNVMYVVADVAEFED